MRRRLFNLATIASLLLAVLVAALWIRSADDHCDSLTYSSIAAEGNQRRTSITTVNGLLIVGTITHEPSTDSSCKTYPTRDGIWI